MELDIADIGLALIALVYTYKQWKININESMFIKKDRIKERNEFLINLVSKLELIKTRNTGLELKIELLISECIKKDVPSFEIENMIIGYKKKRYRNVKYTIDDFNIEIENIYKKYNGVSKDFTIENNKIIGGYVLPMSWDLYIEIEKEIVNLRNLISEANFIGYVKFPNETSNLLKRLYQIELNSINESTMLLIGVFFDYNSILEEISKNIYGEFPDERLLY